MVVHDHGSVFRVRLDEGERKGQHSTPYIRPSSMYYCLVIVSIVLSATNMGLIKYAGISFAMPFFKIVKVTTKGPDIGSCSKEFSCQVKCKFVTRCNRRRSTTNNSNSNSIIATAPHDRRKNEGRGTRPSSKECSRRFACQQR